MPSASNVTTGKPAIAGAIYAAALGTTLPTDASTELSSDFVEVGYISEDGVTHAQNIDSEVVKAWGGKPVMQILKSREDTYKYTMIEYKNAQSARMVYGDDNVTVTGNNITIHGGSTTVEGHVLVIDMILSGDYLDRIVIPSAYLASVGDVNYKDDSVTGYETTMSCMADENGDTFIEYIQQGA